MKIEVLGPGCAKCTKLYEATKEAVQKAGVAAEVTKVSDIAEIMKYGVMATPALVIDGKLAFSGKVASSTEIARLLA
ncbi:MAG: TM0996/MTH895 family glutaredoxin-like protein [Deltaproteobacteria bacterium]|nr:TM0996/MTH895 family glutaredoxin-like protein [Deltaproteobacteria bacterium]